MSQPRAGHLVERAVERMAALGLAPTAGAAPRERASPPPAAQPAAEPAAENDSARPGDAAAPAAQGAPAVTRDALVAAGMVVAGARRSRVAEEWNVTSGRLLSALRAVRQDPQSSLMANLLMVTSSRPNEGKSFAALNLAGSLAVGRMAEVLLLDTDSKPGGLSEILGLAGRPGLFDLAADPRLRPEQLALPTAIPGLCILPVGRGADAVERTVTRPVVSAIETVARQFHTHVVVLDTAPCLATSDASTLAASVGQIAMIVEAELTQRDDLETALDLLRPCANITLVLNKVRLSAAHAFGDYNYYHGGA